MNVTDFSSAKKEHLRFRGANTECNRSTSGIGANDLEQFKHWAENHPENCCKKCLMKYTQLASRKK